MKISLKWLTPVFLRLLSLSHASMANGVTAAAAALQNVGSVHLVAGFYVGLAANTQPHDLSLDPTTAFVQLANKEFAFQIMPLHLLGKKSWNVYNQDNIAKVKRDEAAANAKEEAEEERMQEIDAERRIQILRGERPAPPPLRIEDSPGSAGAHEPESRPAGPLGGRERKKRKRAGEDDTDFELRVARDQTQASHPLSITKPSSSSLRLSTSDAPLTDPSGHISLFPAAHPAPNPEAEREAARTRKEYEDQYTLRFANAAGFKQSLDQPPWYSKPSSEPASSGADAATTTANLAAPPSSRDVWGNAGPARRKQRDEARAAASDPLAAMRSGAARARAVERERKGWREERDREVVEVLRAEQEREERRMNKRMRREDDDDDDDGLEGFTLDKKREDEGVSRRQRRRRRDSDERRGVHGERGRGSARGESRRRSHRERDRNGHRDRDTERVSDRRHHTH